MNILPMLAALAVGGITLLGFPAHADTSTSHAWQQQVAAISAGDTTTARGLAITDQLDALGIAWRTEPFEIDGQAGNNLVADLGGKADAPLLLIGAHYDRVDKGQGATDNASGSSTTVPSSCGFNCTSQRWLGLLTTAVDCSCSWVVTTSSSCQ